MAMETMAMETMAMETIGIGSIGEAVRAWQQILGISVDGFFGPITAAHTRTWQMDHGVDADGVVGPLTWAAAEALQHADTVPPPSDAEVALGYRAPAAEPEPIE